MLILLLVPIFTPLVSANAGPSPNLTVIVVAPPEDLTLSLHFDNGHTSKAVVLPKEQKAWETYYRFFYGWAESDGFSVDIAPNLIVASSQINFEIPLKELDIRGYSRLVTLDLKSQTISLGTSPLRTPFLISMRIFLTLLIEGFLFYTMGYRKKYSWAVFLLTNLLTQGALNLALVGPFHNSYWFFGFIYYEFFILLFEMAMFYTFLTEQERGKGAFFAFVANLASLFLGGMLLSYLPV